MKKLLLWDIDGTLISGGGAGEAALVHAMKECFGIDADLARIDYSGRTDIRIGMMLFEHYGVPVTPDSLHLFSESYLRQLSAEMPNRKGLMFKGVFEILEEVRTRPDLAQGLLTGNLVIGARTKLTHFDLWRYFEFGAFADDSHDRNLLGTFALRRAIEKTNYPFTKEQVYVIGDTPHDVECARVLGAKAIAVATGRFTYEELAALQPHAVFHDLSDKAAFFAALK